MTGQADSTDENVRAESGDHQTAIKALITRIEAHEDEGSDIRVAAEKLGLDAKRIKVIRKAKADAATAQRTLDALFAEKLITPAIAAKVAPAPVAPKGGKS